MKMSLDIAIVLAHLTNRVLVPYRFRLPRRLPTEPGRILEPLLVPDLFDIPVHWSDEYVRKMERGSWLTDGGQPRDDSARRVVSHAGSGDAKTTWETRQASGIGSTPDFPWRVVRAGRCRGTIYGICGSGRAKNFFDARSPLRVASG